MKTLYIDCGMGAAGDMLTAALIELLPDPDEFVEKLNGLGIPGVKIVIESSVKCGITGTHMSVLVDGEEESEHMHEHEHSHHHEHEHSHEHEHEEHHHHHHHSGMDEIQHIISDLKIPTMVKLDILAVYKLIAEAESYVHGVPVDQIHFHEVGTMDAIADITAVCLLMDEIDPDEVVVSPVHVGSGQVKCAHGILPVPAPATAYILKDIPIYSRDIKGELCTPTGAALLKHYATRFGDMPVMKTTAIGYGMGKKDFEIANCVRVMLGDKVKTAPATSGAATANTTAGSEPKIFELSCNVDDMTAEDIAFACERILEEGAREVYTIPIGMKKSRPGTLIRVMCTQDDKEKMVNLIFKYTTTIGIREIETNRYVLERTIETVDTKFGQVRRKVSSGYGVRRVKYEYDDIARIAKEKNLTLDEVRKHIDNA